MSLTKDWMTEDNLSDMPAARARRSLARVWDACLVRACLFSDPRRVGAAFERLRSGLSEDELTALQSATSHPQTPTPDAHRRQA